MKRKFSVFLAILFIFMIGYSPLKVQAKSVSIPLVDIVGLIRKDGTVQMTEKRSIAFDGDFTYGYYDLPSFDSDKITNFTISDESTQYKLDESQSKTSGTYYREINRIYYYFTVSNETKIFTVQYTIKNAINIYEDFGEFYWQLQPDGWDFPVKVFTGLLTWESSIPKDNYYIWAHGPLWGNFTKTDDWKANLRIEDLPNKTAVEVRMLLPNSYFGLQPNKQGKILQTVIQEETKWADDSNLEREKAKEYMEQEKLRRIRLIKIGNVVQVLLYFLAAFLVFLFFYLYKKYGSEHKLANEAIYFREPPSDLKPAIAGMLYNFQKFDDKFLQATILDLIRRKWIQYEEIEGNIFTKDHRMTRLDNTKDALADFEQILMDEILFDL